MGREVLQDPVEAGIPVNRDEGFRTDVGIFRAAQDIADLDDPGSLASRTLQCANKASIDNFARRVAVLNWCGI